MKSIFNYLCLEKVGWHKLTSFSIVDGSGYIDDGREIFDDDLAEEPEGILSPSTFILSWL